MSVTFIDTDIDTLLSDIISDFETLTGRTLETSQPEYIFCYSLAYRVSLLMQRINAAGNSQLVDFATAPILDYLGALVSVTRLTAGYATTTLQFTLVPGHSALTIPAETRVMSTDGNVIFATTEDTTIDADIDIVNITAECQTSGTAGNSYAIGTITQIQDAQSYLSSCTNVDITSGGSDEETDSAYRTRIKEGTAQYSVAGSRKAYKYWAKTASSSIVDVEVMNYSDDNTIPKGQVNIYPLLTGGELAGDSLLETISDILSSEKIRPLNDTVVVKNPTKISYTLTINITKYTAGTTSTIISAVNTLIAAFGKTKYTSLGLDIVNSEIEALCRVDNVYDVDVTISSSKTLTGDNLIISKNEFAYLSDYSINVTSTING